MINATAAEAALAKMLIAAMGHSVTVKKSVMPRRVNAVQVLRWISPTASTAPRIFVMKART